MCRIWKEFTTDIDEGTLLAAEDAVSMGFETAAGDDGPKKGLMVASHESGTSYETAPCVR